MEDSKKVLLTAEGKQKYEEEYSNLINVERPANLAALKAAREQGDLSENADYSAARERQGQIEHRISELKYLLEHAVIIDNKDSSVVYIGTTVTLYMEDLDTTEKYLVVSPTEADPEQGKISDKCLLGAAIYGHKVGDEVVVKVANPYKVKIVDISISRK